MSLRCSIYFLVYGSFRLLSFLPAHTIAGGVGLPSRRTIQTFAGSTCRSRCRVTLTGTITRRRDVALYRGYCTSLSTEMRLFLSLTFTAAKSRRIWTYNQPIAAVYLGRKYIVKFISVPSKGSALTSHRLSTRQKEKPCNV